MSEPLGTHDDGAGAAREEPLRLLYVTGPAPDVDTAATRQLESGGARVTPIDSLRAAVAEIRTAGAARAFHALLLSPALSGEEAVNLITRWHLGHGPVPIVPILTEAHHRLCTDAVAAGAQAVLLQVNGVLAHPDEALDRFRHARPSKRERAEAGGPLRRLRGLFDGATPASHAGGQPEGHGHQAVADENSLRVKARLEEAYVARVRSESHVAPEPLELPPVGYAQADRNDEAQPAPAPHPDDRDGEANSTVRTDDEEPQDEALAAQAELQQVLAASEADQDAWDAARRTLEARIAELEAAALARADAEAALTQVRNDQQATARQHAADRAAWDAMRQALEARVAELEAAAGGRNGGSGDTEATRPEVAPESAEPQATERAVWESTRQTLEQRIRDLWASEHERQRLREILLDSRSQYAKLEGEHHVLETALAETAARVRQLTDEAAALRERLQPASTTGTSSS